jgi:hypothetical protein
MSSRVLLEIGLDLPRGELLIMANQGALYSADSLQGVPAGTALVAHAGPLLSDRVPDGRGELRIQNALEQTVLAVRGADLVRLSRGAPLVLPALPPGDYNLVWWHPESVASPVLTVRVGGI